VGGVLGLAQRTMGTHTLGHNHRTRLHPGVANGSPISSPSLPLPPPRSLPEPPPPLPAAGCTPWMKARLPTPNRANGGRDLRDLRFRFGCETTQPPKVRRVEARRGRTRRGGGQMALGARASSPNPFGCKRSLTTNSVTAMCVMCTRDVCECPECAWTAYACEVEQTDSQTD
jgi:hypothetical protein